MTDNKYKIVAQDAESSTTRPLPADYYDYLVKKNSTAAWLQFIAFIVQVFPGSIFGINALSLKWPLMLKVPVAFCTGAMNIDLLTFMALKGFNILAEDAYRFEDILNQGLPHRTITLSSLKKSLRKQEHYLPINSQENGQDSALETGVPFDQENSSLELPQSLTNKDVCYQAAANLFSIDGIEWMAKRALEAKLTWASLQSYIAFANAVGERYPALKPFKLFLLPGFFQLNFPGVVDVTKLLVEFAGLLAININSLLPNSAITSKLARVNQEKNLAAARVKIAVSLEAFMKTRAFPDHIPQSDRKTAFMSQDLDTVYMVIKQLAQQEAWSEEDKNTLLIAATTITSSDPKWTETTSEKSWSHLIGVPLIYFSVLGSVLIMFTVLLMVLGKDDSFSVDDKIESIWVNVAVALIGGFNFADALVIMLFADAFSQFSLAFDKKHSSKTKTNIAILAGYIAAAGSSGSMLELASELFKINFIQQVILSIILIASIMAFNGCDVMNQILDQAKNWYLRKHDIKTNNQANPDSPLIAESDPLASLLKQEAIIPQLIRTLELMPATSATAALDKAIISHLSFNTETNELIIQPNETLGSRLELHNQLIPEITTSDATTALASFCAQTVIATAYLTCLFNESNYLGLIELPLMLTATNGLIQLIGKSLSKHEHTSKGSIALDVLWSIGVIAGIGISASLFITVYNHIVSNALLTIPSATNYKGTLTLFGCATGTAILTSAATLHPITQSAPKAISDLFKIQSAPPETLAGSINPIINNNLTPGN